MARKLRIRVDHNVCVGNAMCETFAPQRVPAQRQPPIGSCQPGRRQRGEDPRGSGELPNERNHLEDAETGEQLFPLALIGRDDGFRRTGEVRGVATEFPLSAHQAAIRSPAEQGGFQSLTPLGRLTAQGSVADFFSGCERFQNQLCEL